MIRSGIQILADIDSTLDQLIRNAEVLRSVSIHALDPTEVEALQKTQESLLAHILHMDEHLSKKAKKPKKSVVNLQQKIARFSKLNERLMNDITMRFKVPARRPKKVKN